MSRQRLGMIVGLALLALAAACGGGGGQGGDGGVLPKTPTITSFASSTQTVTHNGTVKLMAVFSGEHRAVVDNGVGEIKSAVPKDVVVSQTTKFTLTVTGLDGAVATASCEVVVSSLPSVSLEAVPNPTRYGDVSMLTPTFSGGDGVVDQGVGPVVSGVPFASAPITAPKTYTLTVTGAGGANSSSVIVASTPVSVSPITPSAPAITVNKAMVFSAAASGGITNGISWSASAGSINISTGNWVAPATPGAVTITATSSEDATKSSTTTVNVVGVPDAISLSAVPNPVPYGGMAQVTPVFIGGHGTVGSQVVTSNVPIVVGPVVSSQLLTLTVTNDAGDTDTKPLALDPEVVSVSAITPANVTALSGQTIPFSASVSGAQDPSIIWSATGPGGSGAWSGSTWTAPVPGNYVITAKSAADPSKLSTTAVTVVPGVVTLTSNKSLATGGSVIQFVVTLSGGQTGSIDHGLGAVVNAQTVPFTLPVVSTSTEMVFTLTSNLGGTSEARVTVVPFAKITSFTVE